MKSRTVRVGGRTWRPWALGAYSRAKTTWDSGNTLTVYWNWIWIWLCRKNTLGCWFVEKEGKASTRNKAMLAAIRAAKESRHAK